jgi:hypothetical protein
LLKSLFEYVVGLKNPQVIPIGDQNYSTAPLHRIQKVFDETPCAAAVSIRTLTGLVDYIKNGVDNIKDYLVVHVVSPTEVSVYSELRKDMARSHFILCKAQTPQIQYGSFMDVESFNIMIQSCFIPNEHSEAVLKVVGNIVEENVSQLTDDGVTQAVVGRVGIARNAEIEVPNPVILCPFRTFAEVAQPESKFVFRMQSGPRAAIFEADGGIWRIYAMQNVKAYLSEKLEGCNVKIIS